MKQKAKDENVLAQNRQARHDYFIKDTYEAGIALTGTEIKSVRARHVTLRDGYVQIINGSAFLENVHIDEYKEGNRYNHDPLKPQTAFAQEGNRQTGRCEGPKGDDHRAAQGLLEARLCQGFDWRSAG